MLWNVRYICGFSVRAVDGAIGAVNQFLFDDRQWTIRYLVATIGGSILGQRVLIPASALGMLDWKARAIGVALTQQQVEDSPDISTDQPVSYQMAATSSYVGGARAYLSRSGLWGLGICPGDPAVVAQLLDTLAEQDSTAGQGRSVATPKRDSHLRSTHVVSGYSILARDGAVGHVADFIIDDTTWSIPYIVVATRNWLPRKKVLVPYRWTTRIDWSESRVAARVPQVVIRCSPCYAPQMLADPIYEARLREAYNALHTYERGIGA